LVPEAVAVETFPVQAGVEPEVILYAVRKGIIS
jgi:hypothetical protein